MSDRFQVKIRFPGGSVWKWLGLREIVFFSVFPFLLILPPLLIHHLEWFLFLVYGVLGFQFFLIFWFWTPKWVATLSPALFEHRSFVAACFGAQSWKKIGWDRVQSVRSAGTREYGGTLYNQAVEVEYWDWDGASGLLRISSAEKTYLKCLEKLILWVDPAKVDPDLLRILDKQNQAAWNKKTKKAGNFGMVLGFGLGAVFLFARTLPLNDRWLVYGSAIFLSLAFSWFWRLRNRS